MTDSKTDRDIWDAIHGSIPFSMAMLMLIDSDPFQRLRHVHQLALTFLVYPGATHKRFEHSLGVAYLAGLVFDVVTNPKNLSAEALLAYPELHDKAWLSYWRDVVVLAALCHDLGHLPFSHAAEKRLLPEGWTHERMTLEIIRSEAMRKLLASIDPGINPEDIAKVAVGKKVYLKDTEKEMGNLEAVLSEIIIGDAFGVDRMDYLLRDAHNCGLAYGKFDYLRLVNTLRILPGSSSTNGVKAPVLGLEYGGLHASESLMMARYFLYSRVYFHPVRRIYDRHLANFMLARPEFAKKFPVKVDEFLDINDNHILAMIQKAAKDRGEPGHADARRLHRREHFRLVCDAAVGTGLADLVEDSPMHKELHARFGEENIFLDEYEEDPQKKFNFPVRLRDGEVLPASKASRLLRNMPRVKVGYLFADRMMAEDVKEWLEPRRRK